ncbi:MAG: tripartite tricarboxylate transporter substrate binding protein, partial [Pseudomonadota bacterium]
VNNPSEALGFYEAGTVIPLVAFTNDRLPMFPEVPTLKEVGGDFAYFMQRAVVGAPGMSEAAQQYYTDMFTKVYNSADWQDYKSKKSLMGDFMAGADLKDYWKTQRDRHQTLVSEQSASN